jgi:uncharacterized protein (DUF1330 family)
MPEGYLILTEAVHDEAGMAAYSRAAAPSMISGRATVLAVDAGSQVLEGTWHGNRTIVLEFESVEAAREWYESAEYAKAKPMRHAAADSNAVIVAGFEMPPRA